MIVPILYENMLEKLIVALYFYVPRHHIKFLSFMFPDTTSNFYQRHAIWSITFELLWDIFKIFAIIENIKEQILGRRNVLHFVLIARKKLYACFITSRLIR